MTAATMVSQAVQKLLDKAATRAARVAELAKAEGNEDALRQDAYTCAHVYVLYAT